MFTNESAGSVTCNWWLAVLQCSLFVALQAVVVFDRPGCRQTATAPAKQNYTLAVS